MGSSTGRIFRVTTFGESHGPAIGAVIEGCPPGLHINLKSLQADMARRKPGQSKLTTSRGEDDHVDILSGVFEGVTTGTPISLLIKNKDARSVNYDGVKDLYRPGHGDATYMARYGIRDYRGGGRASARETAARVAAASIARQWLAKTYDIQVIAWVDQVGVHRATVSPHSVTTAQVESNLTRCPDPQSAILFEKMILAAKREGDTLGGVIGAVARNLPAGWGDPVFDKLEADLAKACLSLPACKGFEVGSGFAGVHLKGSEHNDQWLPPTLPTTMPKLNSNHAGGVLAGITTGSPISIRCAFKPVSTHFKKQRTVTTQGEAIDFQNEGRHDPCVLPRAVPLVESAMLLTLMDHALRTLALGRDLD
jgi:chorismate synthase